ncbi:uncharacterized protein EKO05_0007886 [Ascochyta rabiei]|uniref:Uncharacterized protein n=1 Tax=Didymella rabiei TaxID=5454 RepID=A0A163BVZ7_DIDRA|nr:uncharacterized protein EKO05_0007886 [Ascochyta rabiei]KZM22041.1 hypothetical protein ST47_g6772 [Ascochyta rabiei]UPX17537.1 hypothetical protein EKO05_0007886 [Ascochyta rabiei]
MQYSALCQTPKDGATASIDMLDANDSRGSVSTQNQKIKHKSISHKELRGFPWRVFLIVSLVPLCLAPIVILSAIAEMASQNYIRGRSCYPNGLWKEAEGATWRIMDSTYFFTPNLSFGNMTFTQVKVIDIAWDLIIGRGGQMCLAWVNWRVSNEWLVYHLERYKTSYKMFASVTLQTTSLTTLGVLAKEFLCFGERSWGRFFRWLAMFCMLISTLYVLAFPTLMAAMTGYITTYEPYVEDYNHNLVEWGKVDEIVKSISGADGIGFDDMHVWVTSQDEELLRAVNRFIGKYSNASNTRTEQHTMGDGTQEYNMPGKEPNVTIFRVGTGTNWEFEDVITTVQNPNISIATYLSTGRSPPRHHCTW